MLQLNLEEVEKERERECKENKEIGIYLEKRGEERETYIHGQIYVINSI